MTRVIGIGSPFGDDQVGWHVVELLQGRVPDGVELLTLDRPGATLVNWMGGVERLVLIDALDAADEPGRIVEIDPLHPQPSASRLSCHGLDIAQTLALADALGCRPARTELYGIVIETLDVQGLSRPVAAAARRLADVLAARLQHDGAASTARRGDTLGLPV